MTASGSAVSRMRAAVLAEDVDTPKTLIYGLGAAVAIGVLSFLHLDLELPLLVTSFGASAVILFAMPGIRAARPRNVFFGHVMSALVALALYFLLGCTWYSLTLAVVFSILLMVYTDTVHPPGGATAIACITGSPQWYFFLTPVAVGALVLIAVAWATGAAYSRYAGGRGAGQ